MKKTLKFLALALTIAIIAIVCTGCATSTTTSSTNQEIPTIKIGETWTVDGQWKLTITNVEKTSDRNEYDDHNPAEVLYVTYTYENLGYTDSSGIMEGLYIDLTSSQIVDGAGEMGYSYSAINVEYPDQVPVGAKKTAKVCIGLNNASETVTLNYSTYDGNSNKQSAKFVLDL
jgi:hypothetical protein